MGGEGLRARPDGLIPTAAAVVLMLVWAGLFPPVAFAHDGDHRGQSTLDHALTIAIDAGALIVLSLPIAVLLARLRLSGPLRAAIAFTCFLSLLYGGAVLTSHWWYAPLMIANTDFRSGIGSGVAWQTAIAAAGTGAVGLIAMLVQGRQR